MGRTIPSYRQALEAELRSWKAFADALRRGDREVFEELMDVCRENAPAAGAATRPVIFEAMAMTILLSHQKMLRKICSELGCGDERVDPRPIP